MLIVHADLLFIKINPTTISSQPYSRMQNPAKNTMHKDKTSIKKQNKTKYAQQPPKKQKKSKKNTKPIKIKNIDKNKHQSKNNNNI
ncbi:TPA: hypothetical protein JZE26_004776 [Escherichia coli]|nr:hypothetical protein [Escherichia coli]HCQ4618483.1 hypothetical protein [Escherichia coli]